MTTMTAQKSKEIRIDSIMNSLSGIYPQSTVVHQEFKTWLQRQSSDHILLIHLAVGAARESEYHG